MSRIETITEANTRRWSVEPPFEYIIYSRLAFADISGMNPNVLYEIGVRHGVAEAGTVLFRHRSLRTQRCSVMMG
ncbi:MAG: hypothetical protein QNM02_11410 [Acidimicrobiia bacterium]|nr:hypothetical protein [Acidimicrobiia bacterium]